MKGDSLVLKEAYNRIRELEAELAIREAELQAANTLGAGTWRLKEELKARAEKAEDRVAELTDLLNRVFEHDGAVYLGPDLIIELRDLVPRPGFAREREAEKTSAEWQAVAEQRTEAWQKAQAAEARIRQEKAENDIFWSSKVNQLQDRIAELEKGSLFFSDLPGWAQEKIQSLVRSLDRMEREAREREAK